MALKNIFKKNKDKTENATAPKQVAQIKDDQKEDKKITKQEKKKEKTTSKAKNIPEKYDRIIIKPYITEKSAVLAHANQYVFVVDRKVGQIEIKNTIKAMYGITPTKVNIQNYYGKAVRFGRRSGKRSAWKKAIITLPKGTRIDVYEGV
ncbi:MAG: 50S ribosomal protein L23 [Candidatus Uhrbacteria bacterium]|nr:50S ribosomal protein L23 [Patescibacteria group bacterium]